MLEVLDTGIGIPADAIASVRQQLGADLKAVLITSDTSSAMRRLEHDERLRIVSKPMNADELLSLLRELLRRELLGVRDVERV